MTDAKDDALRRMIEAFLAKAQRDLIDADACIRARGRATREFAEPVLRYCDQQLALDDGVPEPLRIQLAILSVLLLTAEIFGMFSAASQLDDEAFALGLSLAIEHGLTARRIQAEMSQAVDVEMEAGRSATVAEAVEAVKARLGIGEPIPS